MHPNLPTWIISSLALVVSGISLFVSLRSSGHARRAKDLDLKAELQRRLGAFGSACDRLEVKMASIKSDARKSSNFALYDAIVVLESRGFVQKVRPIQEQLHGVRPSDAMGILERISDDLQSLQREAEALERQLDEMVKRYPSDSDPIES